MPLYQTFVSLTLPEKNISHFTIIPHSQHHFGSTHIGEQIFSRMKDRILFTERVKFHQKSLMNALIPH